MADEDFNPHEMVERLMSPTANDETPPEGGSEVPQPPSSESAPPSQPSVEELQQKLATADKRYNDLQSDIDRRVNVAVRQATDSLSGKLDELTATLSRRNPQENAENGDFSAGEVDPARLAAMMREEAQKAARAAAAELLEKDERLSDAKTMTDLARFRAAHPDSMQMTPMIQDVFETLPWVPKTSEGFEATYTLLKKWVDMALSAARTAEEAAKTPAQGNTQPPQQQPYGQRVTPEQAAQLAANAERYQTAQGVSASSTVKPSINPQGDLRTELEKMVRATREKYGF